MNISNYVNKPISGREAKEWIDYNLSNPTQYSHLAQTLQRYAIFEDDKAYIITQRKV